MGVSLERVQFKFASIIGELCSEPDVLSQFAVWLDLRLAEYKLKGNISLECSGVEPDPVWLKGLSKGKQNIQVNQTDTRTENRSSPPSFKHVEPIQLTQNSHHSAVNFHNISTAAHPSANLLNCNRLLPGVVPIKKERNDSLYSHCIASKPHPTSQDLSSRKRPVPNFTNSNQSPKALQLPTCIQPKQRRLSLPTPSPVNQSLSSPSYGQPLVNGRRGGNSTVPNPTHPTMTSPQARRSLDSQNNPKKNHSENTESNFSEDFYRENVSRLTNPVPIVAGDDEVAVMDLAVDVSTVRHYWEVTLTWSVTTTLLCIG